MNVIKGSRSEAIGIFIFRSFKSGNLQQARVAVSYLRVNYHFDYCRYRLPFRAPLWTAHGCWEAREGVILRLESEGGAISYGEACPIPWFGTETVNEVEEACRQVGAETNDAILDGLPEKLCCLRSAVHSARMDWNAPEDESARAVAALLPSGKQALDLIEPRAEAGFSTFKWKVGVGSVADELVLLDDICGRLSGGAKLRLDANGAWERRYAEKWLDRCADYPVEYVEQPCFAEAYAFAKAMGDKSAVSAAQRRAEDLLLGLEEDFPTPLALDESIMSGHDVTRWIDKGWPGYFVLKTSLMGEAANALAALEKADAKVVFSSALETAVGAKAALKRAFAWNGSPHALGFGVWPLFNDFEVNGPAAAPFIRWDDVTRIDEEALWNALS